MRLPERGSPQYKFGVVVTARLTSVFGTFLSMMALNIFILELTGSVGWVGMALAIKVLVGMLATPFIGHAVDRRDRKRLMIISDCILAAAMVLLTVVPDAWAKYYIVFLMALLGVFSSLFEVALSAAVPEILGTQDTLKANSWFLGGRNLVVGASAICAVAANIFFRGFTVIFLIDAATYLISAAALYTLDIRTAGERPPEKPEEGLFSRIRREFAEVRALENSRVVALFLAVLFLDTFASGSHNVGFPVFSRLLPPAKPMYFYGFILFFWAMGNIVGIYLLNKQAWLSRLRPETLYLSFTALMSVGMILIFQTSSPVFIASAALLAGMGDGTYQTYFTTYVQQVPDSVRGKVFALSSFALRTGFGLGYAVVPLVMAHLSVGRTVLLFHGTTLLILIALVLTPGLLVPAESGRHISQTS